MSDWQDPNLPDFHKDNIFLFLLRKIFEVEIDNENPEVLFYTLVSRPGLINFQKYANAKKIFFTQEPCVWDKKEIDNFYNPWDRFHVSLKNSDYIISPYFIEGEEYFRFSLYLLYAYQMLIDGRIKNFESLTQSKNFKKEDIAGRKFCTFLSRNYQSWQKRFQFESKLSNYKKVDIAKVDGFSYEKCQFIKNYKFTFAFENNDGNVPSCGFVNRWIYLGGENVSEKILEPLISNTIPLYWGYNKIGDEFNKDAFVNWYDFNDDEKMIEKIIELDNDDDLYLEMLNQPAILDFDKSQFNFDGILGFLEKII